MSGENEHGRLISAAAKSALSPLGVVRKGRSRTWLDDHGWWLGIVEFQPSNWSRGTYLNVTAMFLWRPIDYMAFEIGHRVDEFSAADSDDFEAAVHAKAELAAATLTALRAQLPSVSGVVEYYTSQPRPLSMIEESHLATAYGLLGDLPRLQQGLDRALALREDMTSSQWNASAWLPMAREAASTQAGFRTWVSASLAHTRGALKLSHVEVQVTV